VLPLALCLPLALQAGNPLARVDDRVRAWQNILHYAFAIEIPDTGQTVSGTAWVWYRPTAPDRDLVLDFADDMEVLGVVTPGGDTVSFAHEGDSLLVRHWGPVGDSVGVRIVYRGAPSDGLVIQADPHGRRAAFADDWPTRAHCWLPVEDDPSDKATVSWVVTAPGAWMVIANGRFEDTTRQADGRLVWRYAEMHPIPAYTFVIGAGELVVTPLASAHGVALSLWTDPEDSAFAVARPFWNASRIVDVFADYVGPFPYEKLAHVESSTRFGGMENASAIFYASGGYARRTMGEDVVAHETAHQWFGDAVTEGDWHHLWLSEGFATYFAAFYHDLTGDSAGFRRRMDGARAQYVASEVVDRPILDFGERDLMRLLNANNYQKGAWVLHMLRREIGDDAFARGIREYYRLYRDSTALSQDLRAVMERASGKDLDRFFRQWLTQPGYPTVRVVVRRDAGPSGEAEILIEQVQPLAWGTFAIPVRVDVRSAATGARASVTIRMTGRVGRAWLRLPAGADTIEVDPLGDVLLSATSTW
jgi:aminopeptidase N